MPWVSGAPTRCVHAAHPAPRTKPTIAPRVNHTASVEWSASAAARAATEKGTANTSATAAPDRRAARSQVTGAPVCRATGWSRRRCTGDARTAPGDSLRRRPARSSPARPGDAPEWAAEAQLSRVEDAARVEGVLHCLQHVDTGAERL